MTTIDRGLLEIMECPVGHAPLVQVGDWLYSTDPVTRRRYPIRDGIPIMLIDQAEVVDPKEFERIMSENRRATGPGVRDESERATTI
jgi:uncharacterized protein YbaR (Trm112 family)